jgi:two-component SAPR family response regulator
METVIAMHGEPGMEKEGSSRNAVYLMGEFVAYDRNGHDITHLFSPKIKQLFVLILLHSTDGKGIGSNKISSKLWPEKEPAKTKNIKGVTFNHLRSIINDIDGIELVFLNDHYAFQFGEAFFCDFCVLSDFIRENAPGPVLPYFKLIARGPLLGGMPESLLDDIRSPFEDRLIGILIPELIRLYDARDFKLALEMAKLILTIDSFNEEALKYQLKSCRRLKGIEYSRKAYDQFTQGYEKSLGVAYHVSFDKIVQ